MTRDNAGQPGSDKDYLATFDSSITFGEGVTPCPNPRARDAQDKGRSQL